MICKNHKDRSSKDRSRSRYAPSRVRWRAEQAYENASRHEAETNALAGKLIDLVQSANLRTQSAHKLKTVCDETHFSSQSSGSNSHKGSQKGGQKGSQKGGHKGGYKGKW